MCDDYVVSRHMCRHIREDSSLLIRPNASTYKNEIVKVVS